MSLSYKELYDVSRNALTAEPEKARATFSVESRQLAGFHSEVNARQFRIQVDEPPTLGGTDKGANPVEYVLAALATCQEITYRLYADALGIPLKGVAVKLEGNLDLRGFLGVDGETRPGFTDIRGTVTLDSPASPEQLRQLKETVDRHCPVLDILSQPTPVTLELAPATKAAA